MRPARSPLARKHLSLAKSIDRARCCGFNPDYQEGIRAVALAIAEDLVVPSERASFVLACGIDVGFTSSGASALDSSSVSD
jgi:hypothetical protein